MTINTQVPSYIETPGNGVSTVFNFPFKVFAATDVVVGFITAGVYARQTSGYTVTNIDVNGGGTLTFSVAPASGITVDIRTATPLIQPTEFANLGQFLPEAHTDAFDRVVREVQDLYRTTYTFGIHGPDQESVPWPTLPTAAGRANTSLGFDGNGLPSIVALLSSALTQSVFNTFQSASPPYVQTSAESAAGVFPTNSTYLPGNVLRYGADRLGATPSLSAFNQAYAQATVFAAHTPIYIPAGTYLIPSPGLTWTTQTDLRVYGDGPHLSVLTYSGSNYTVLSMTADIGAGTTGQNLDLANFGISATFGTTTNVNALFLADYFTGSLTNLQLYASGNCLQMQGMAAIACSNLDCVSGGTNSSANSALILTQDTNGDACGPLTFSSCNFNGQGNVTVGGALWSNRTVATTFTNCMFIAFGPSLANVIALTNQDDVTFIGCYSESSTNTLASTANLFHLGLTSAPNSVTIIGGTFFAGQGGPTLAHAIFGNNVQALTVIGATFAGFAISAITYGTTGATMVVVLNTYSSGAGNPPVLDSSLGGPTLTYQKFWSAPPLVTGWGTPTGAAVEANYAAGSGQTMAITSAALAKFITDMKTLGFYGT